MAKLYSYVVDVSFSLNGVSKRENITILSEKLNLNIDWCKDLVKEELTRLYGHTKKNIAIGSIHSLKKQ